MAKKKKQPKSQREKSCQAKFKAGSKEYKQCMSGVSVKKKPFEHIDEDAFTGQLDDKG